MKTIIFLFAVLMLALGACETIEIEKLIYDTVYVDRPPKAVAASFITTVDTVVIIDTVEVKVIVRDTVILEVHTTDTVYQYITKDSLIIKEIEKVIYHTDTLIQVVHDTVINNIHHYDTVTETIILHDTVTVKVYDRTVVYLDSFVVVSYMRPVESIPEDIIPHVAEFYALCQQHGVQAPGGYMIIQYVAELPGEGWSSNSFQISDNSQIIIELDQRYPAALHRAGVLREMAKIQLGKKYTQIPDRIMNPTFSPEATITTNHLNQIFQ